MDTPVILFSIPSITTESGPTVNVSVILASPDTTNSVFPRPIVTLEISALFEKFNVSPVNDVIIPAEPKIDCDVKLVTPTTLNVETPV